MTHYADQGWNYVIFNHFQFDAFYGIHIKLRKLSILMIKSFHDFSKGNVICVSFESNHMLELMRRI